MGLKLKLHKACTDILNIGTQAILIHSNKDELVVYM